MRLQICCPSDPAIFQVDLMLLSLRTARCTNRRDTAIEEMVAILEMVGIVETPVYQI